jgi:hypothetical protein
LTYANVVATLALFLALTGGAAFAASKITSKQIGKGAVKNKNLAKNAIKAKNLTKNAVTGAKLANNSVSNPKLADGSVNLAKIAAGTNVVATASTGPIAVSSPGLAPHGLNPPMTLTPVAGQPMTILVETHGTLIKKGKGTEGCSAIAIPTINGDPQLIGELLTLMSPESGSPFPNGVPRSSASIPVGLTEPGKPQAIGFEVISGEECAEGSTIEATVAATQIK